MTLFEPPRADEKVTVLKRVPVFASCTDTQLHLIADRTRLVEYKKGEYIYREGDPANAFYIISSGRLRVFTSNGAAERTLVVLHNGDSFGEVSLLTGENHSATIEALNDTLVLQLQKKDFDHLINRVPSLVLYLSRLLSKRLRTKERVREFAETTIVALCSPMAGPSHAGFTVSLAAMLKRETGKTVAILDFRGTEQHHPTLYGLKGPTKTSRHTLLGTASEKPFSVSVSDYPTGFSVLFASKLLAHESGEQGIAPILNFLTNRFQFIVIDLPLEPTAIVLKALAQSDLIYLISDASREQIIRTNAFIQQVHSAIGAVDQRMKVILSLLGGPLEQLRLPDVISQVRAPVAYTLPYVGTSSGQLTAEEVLRVLDDRDSPYARVVRRIARGLGGMLVGLALGSGAALGLAHIGVLKVIEREKIPIDIVAGSSIGALVGGLWASGRSADELEQMALRFRSAWEIRQLFLLDFGIPILSLFVGCLSGIGVGTLAGFWTGLLFGFMVATASGLILGPLAGGPIQGARLMKKLQGDFGGKTFEETWLPLKIVASSPMEREEVVFESGPIANAVRASVSIPGIFKPVRLHGKVCLDGGVVSPIPVSVLKRSGANRVIAVNVFPTTPEVTGHLREVQRRRDERAAQLGSRSLPIRLLARLRQEIIRSVTPLIFDVIMRSMQAMEHQIGEVACREADLTLRPTVPGSHWLEFYNPAPFIRRGEEVALQYLPELRRITQGTSVDNAEGGQ